MAEWVLTIPDAIEARLLDAVAARRGYDPASGVPKRQFARRALLAWLRDLLEQHEGHAAATVAERVAVAAIRQEMPDE